jgi:hypothetical protein
VSMQRIEAEWPIVTLCGSMRFFPQMLQVAAELTNRGIIVVSPFVVVDPEHQATSREKRQLDELHRAKIRLAQEIVVVTDGEGYYGESTSLEIDYAHSLGKGVVFRPMEVSG